MDKQITHKTHLPMGNMDYDKTTNCSSTEDYEMLLQYVICEDAELLFLDALLSESLSGAVN